MDMVKFNNNAPQWVFYIVFRNGKRRRYEHLTKRQVKEVYKDFDNHELKLKAKSWGMYNKRTTPFWMQY